MDGRKNTELLFPARAILGKANSGLVPGLWGAQASALRLTVSCKAVVIYYKPCDMKYFAYRTRMNFAKEELEFPAILLLDELPWFVFCLPT